MADQNIKVKVKAEWANINELMAELDAALATRKTKSGKPLPKSKEVLARESEVRSKYQTMGTKVAAGISPKEMSQDFTDFFLSFKELILSLLTATQSAKDEVSKLNQEVHALQTTKNVKELELTRTLKKGVLDESGVLTSTKKARQDAMRDLAISNRSGGRGQFYTTTDITKLDRIMNELLSRAQKIEGDTKATSEQKTEATDLRTDASRIADAITMLNNFDKTLNQDFKNLTTEITKLNSLISTKQQEAFNKYENLPTPETDLEVQGLGSSIMKTETAVDEEVQEDIEKTRKATQELNEEREKSVQIDNKQRGSVSKLLASFFGYQMALRALRKL